VRGGELVAQFDDFAAEVLVASVCRTARLTSTLKGRLEQQRVRDLLTRYLPAAPHRGHRRVARPNRGHHREAANGSAPS
jgi:hypothetical protein